MSRCGAAGRLAAAGCSARAVFSYGDGGGGRDEHPRWSSHHSMMAVRERFACIFGQVQFWLFPEARFGFPQACHSCFFWKRIRWDLKYVISEEKNRLFFKIVELTQT